MPRSWDAQGNLVQETKRRWDSSGNVVSEEPVSPPGLLSRAGTFVAEQGPIIAGAAVGGTIGASLGPPGVALGGTIGGAAGEALKQLIRRAVGGGPVPQTGQEALGAINRAALSGGIQEVGGVLAPKIASRGASGLRNAATKDYERVLSATTAVNKAKAAKIIPGLLERGVIAPSRKALQTRLAFETAQAGEAIGAKETAIIAAERAGTTARNIDSQALLKSLDTFRDKMLVPGTKFPIVGNQAGLSAIDAQVAKLKELVDQQGRYLSKESAIGLRRILDEQVVASKQGAYLGADLAAKSLAKAQREFANALRRELAAKEPDLAKLNSEFSFWKSGLDVIKATNLRKISQTGIVDRILGAGGMGAGGGALAYALTGSTREAAGAGLALAALRKAMQTTAWKTTSAVAKSRIADALASGDTQAALGAIARVGAATTAAELQAESR